MIGRVLLFLGVVKTIFTGAQEESAFITFNGRSRRTTKIFGTFELGTKGKGVDDMQCFKGYDLMKECCLADKFGNCVAGPSAVPSEGPFMENVLANKGFSTLTGMTSWKSATGLCIECCDQSRLSYDFYTTFRLVCPKEADDAAFRAFIDEQKAGEGCNDGVWNQDEDGVDCGSPCNIRETPLDSCTLTIKDGEDPKCEQDCKADEPKSCKGPFPDETVWIKDINGGKCYHMKKGSTKNLPGCPPGSKGKQCDEVVLCKSAEGFKCTQEELDAKTCWPSDVKGTIGYCESGCDKGDEKLVHIWNYKEEKWDCGKEEDRATATASATSGGLFVFRFARRATYMDSSEVTCTLEYDPKDKIQQMVGYDLVLLVEERRADGDYWVGVNACRAYPIFQGKTDHTITAADRIEVLRHPSTKSKMDNDKAKWEKDIKIAEQNMLIQRIHITNLTPECPTSGAWSWKKSDWDLYVKDNWPFPPAAEPLDKLPDETRVNSPAYTTLDEKSKTDGKGQDLAEPAWYTPRPEGVCAGCTQSIAVSLLFGLTLWTVCLL